MQIKDLMEKAEQGQFQLLSLLSHTAKELQIKDIMTETGLSKTTITKYAEALNDFFEHQNLEISVLIEKESLCLIQSDNRHWKTISYHFLEGAVKYQVLVYLFKHHHFTIQTLSQDLLVSEATLNRHLAQLNQLLQEYQLTIANGRMRGPELMIRTFYFELFWETWDKENFEKQIILANYSTEIHMIERLCRVSLTEHQLEKWLLWIFVTLRRMGSNQKDFSELEKMMTPYLDNIFYQRLYQISLRYFAQYAMEFEDGEAMCLFVFLATRFVLPIHTMEYLLGFGGPVVELLTRAIQLIRESGYFQDSTHEQVTYHLGQWFGRRYFCRGGLVSDLESYHITKSPYSYLLTEDLLELSQEIMGLVSEDSLSQDLNQKMNWRILQLLLFLAQKKQDYVTIGVDIADGQLKSDLVIHLLQHYLENNQFYQLKGYNEDEEYDYIISNQSKITYQNHTTYYLNKDLSMKDIEAIAGLLKGD